MDEDIFIDNFNSAGIADYCLTLIISDIILAK